MSCFLKLEVAVYAIIQCPGVLIFAFRSGFIMIRADVLCLYVLQEKLTLGIHRREPATESGAREEQDALDLFVKLLRTGGANPDPQESIDVERWRKVLWSVDFSAYYCLAPLCQPPPRPPFSLDMNSVHFLLDGVTNIYVQECTCGGCSCGGLQVALALPIE